MRLLKNIWTLKYAKIFDVDFCFSMLGSIKRYEFILHQSNQNLNLNSWTERKNLTPHPPPTVS